MMKPLAGPVSLGLATLAVGLATAQAQGSGPGPGNLALACTGPFAKDSTAERVASVFGKANVATESVDVGEGQSERATVVFGRDPTRRVEIFWADPEKQTGPINVRVRDPKSRWRGPGGVAMGTGLDVVERVNGRPFELAGFDWDLGGAATDWKGGTLAAVEGNEDCNFTAVFEADPKAPASSRAAVTGDQAFPSTNPDMRAVKPRVVQLGLSISQAE